jgi:formimidoylglutamase
MTGFAPASPWESTATDPVDETFGDVVERAGLRDLQDDGEADVVIAGEPFDAAVIGRRGAATGPSGIRTALAGVTTHSFDAGSAAADLAIRDLGDADVSSIDAASIQRRVAALAEDVHHLDALPVFLGGDNSLTYANVSPLLDGGSVGIVNFDAHLDVREVRETPTSGTPYRQLLEAGLDAYACVGARHHETSTPYVEYVRERGGEILTAETVGRNPDAALDWTSTALSDVDAVYVSVDCDVLDAGAAPGVSAPTPGGLTTRELFRLVRQLGGEDRLAGVEVVECAPPLDSDDRTARAAARTVAHFIAGYAGADDA